MKWFDLIKSMMFVIALCLVGVAATTLLTQTIPAPGATGMNSNSGAQEMKVTDARYLENTDILKTTGVIGNRDGIIRVGATDQRNPGLKSYYDAVGDRKMLIGLVSVGVNDSTLTALTGAYVIGAKDSIAYESNDSTWFHFSTHVDSLTGILRASDTFSTSLNVVTPNDARTLKKQYARFDDTYHDFVNFRELVIHSDGSKSPSVFSSYEYDDAPTPDTGKFSPRYIDMSLPRPGQLRATVVTYADGGSSSTLDGLYEYTYTVYDRAGDSTSDTAYHSIIVKATNEFVLLDGFLGWTFVNEDTVSQWFGTSDAYTYGSTIKVFRRKVNPVEAGSPDTTKSASVAWKLIKTLNETDIGAQLLIVDSGAASGGTLADETIEGPAPGAAKFSRVHTDTIYTDVHFVWTDTAMWVRWSWYDPITGIESPLSPISWSDPIVDSVSGPEWFPTVWSLPYMHKAQAAADYVRIYRTVKDASLVGAGDSTIYYCVLEMPVDNAQTNLEGNAFVLGMIPDTVLGNGVPVFADLSQNYNAHNTTGILAGDASPYTVENEPYDVNDGGLIVRPPFIGQNQIQFNDMEYSNNRLWGIGDPMFPQRLYYSGIDDINDWSALAHLSMDEGESDELVALEKVETTSGEILYALKHNSTYIVAGSDPEYDAEIYRISSEYGAVNRHAVIKAGDGVYFMTTGHRIYSIRGNKIDWISYPIQDICDSLFPTSNDAKIRSFQTGDRANFIQTVERGDTASMAVSWDWMTNTWSIITYANNVTPVGSTRYDTIQSRVGFSQHSFWLYENDTANAFRWVSWDSLYDRLTSSSVFEFPIAYESPMLSSPGIGWLHQIMSVNATIEAVTGQNITATVRNKAGDVIATDVISADANTFQDYTFTFPSHMSKYVSVRITGSYIEWIDDVTIEYRRVGRANIY